MFAQHAPHRFEIPVGRVRVQADDGVVVLDRPELVVDDVPNRIMQAEADEHQRRAAADADEGHEETPLVAEDVPAGDLPGERHPPPQRSDVFEQDTLAGLRRTRQHQPGGGLAQAGHHGEPGAQQGHADAETAGEQCGARLDGQRQRRRGHRVDDGVRPHDDIRQDLAQRGDADDGSGDARRGRVGQILAGDGAGAVAERLVGADLDALVLHHAGHGGQGHECGHQEEHGREHVGDAVHAFAVRLIAGRALALGAVEHIEFGRLHGVDFGLRVRQLRLGIGELLFGLGLLLAELRAGRGDLAVHGIQLRGGVQLLRRLFELRHRSIAFGLIGGAAFVQFLLEGACDVVEAGGGQVVGVPFDAVGDPGHGLFVVIGSAFVRPRALHCGVDLGVRGVGGEGVARRVQVLFDHAGAERGRPEADRVRVVRGADGADDGELAAVQRPVQRIGAVEHMDGLSDVRFAGGSVGGDHAFVLRRRPPAVAQQQTVEVPIVIGGDGHLVGLFAVLRAVRQQGDPDGGLFVTHLHHRIGGYRGHGIRDALDILHALHIVIGESECGEQPDVPQVRAVVIPVGGRTHVGAAHLQSREETAAERHDADDGQEPSERTADGTPDDLGERAVHQASEPSGL